MNPQPQTIIHHSAVIVNRPKRGTNLQPASANSDQIGKLIGADVAFLLRNISWIQLDCTTNEPWSLLHSQHCVFINTRISVFFPERRFFRGWQWCEKEMRGKVGHFFDIQSSTKRRTSAESNTDFCQERITQWRDFLVDESIVFEDPTLSELYMYRFFW